VLYSKTLPQKRKKKRKEEKKEGRKKGREEERKRGKLVACKKFFFFLVLSGQGPPILSYTPRPYPRILFFLLAVLGLELRAYTFSYSTIHFL
jgi:hypothetical protein